MESTVQEFLMLPNPDCQFNLLMPMEESENDRSGLEDIDELVGSSLDCDENQSADVMMDYLETITHMLDTGFGCSNCNEQFLQLAPIPESVVAPAPVSSSTPVSVPVPVPIPEHVPEPEPESVPCPELKAWELLICPSETNGPLPTSFNSTLPDWLIRKDSFHQDRFATVRAVDSGGGRLQLIYMNVDNHAESPETHQDSDSDEVIFIEVTNDPTQEDQIVSTMANSPSKAQQPATEATSSVNIPAVSDVATSGTAAPATRKSTAAFESLAKKRIHVPLMNPGNGSRVGDKSRRKQQLCSFTDNTFGRVGKASPSTSTLTESTYARSSNSENIEHIQSVSTEAPKEVSKIRISSRNKACSDALHDISNEKAANSNQAKRQYRKEGVQLKRK